MRNRAMCKICESIIESKTTHDTVVCTCGMISVSGGEQLGCASKDWANFLRIDEDDNVIIPKIVDKKPPTKEELLKNLDNLIERIEDMPKEAMVIAVNHYDYITLLMLISSLFKVEEAESS